MTTPTTATADTPATAQATATADARTVRLDPRNVWRAGFVVIALVVVAIVGRFVLVEGRSVLVTILMAWFASIAMEPAVRPLSRRMPRAAATGLVMGAILVGAVVFLTAFGNLFVQQAAQLLGELPELFDAVVAWVNGQLGSELDVQELIGQLGISPGALASYGAEVVGGLLGVLLGVLGGVFSMFTFALFTFYLSADGPRFRLYLATLFPQAVQPLAVQVWDLTAQKTGRYVAARVILATINSTATAIAFLAIGLPSWFALAVWTGLVAQFIPTIGTYISIALPVLVGLVSPTPWMGVAVLAWGIVYQQVENLTIEPRISAKAVDVHPAVAFGFVMLGAALFGVGGALLAIPVGAMLIALADVRNTRYALRPDLADGAELTTAPRAPEPARHDADHGGPGDARGDAPVDDA